MNQRNFYMGQIVRGVVAGTFEILGFRDIGGVACAQLKPVNPDNHKERGKGEIALPLEKITATSEKGFLDENEAPQGYIAVLKSEVSGRGDNICNHCDYRSKCNGFEWRCMPFELANGLKRHDGCSVIFKSRVE
jgi:hypothetical protein